VKYGSQSKEKEFPCPGFIKKIANKKILQFAECVATLMSTSNITEYEYISLKDIVENKLDMEVIYHCRLARLLLDLFIDKESDSIYNKKAREKLKYFFRKS